MEGTVDQALVGMRFFIAAIVYSALGLVILSISFVVFDKITPGNLWKEIVEEKNLALAITTGAMTLAVAHIIAAAIHS